MCLWDAWGRKRVRNVCRILRAHVLFSCPVSVSQPQWRARDDANHRASFKKRLSLGLEARIGTETQCKAKHFEGPLRKHKPQATASKQRRKQSSNVAEPMTSAIGLPSQAPQPPTHLTGLDDTLLAFMPGVGQPRGLSKLVFISAGRGSPPAGHDELQEQPPRYGVTSTALLVPSHTP